MSRHQEGRDEDRGMQTRSAGCENIMTRDLKMSKALMSLRRIADQGRRVIDPTQAERNSGGPEAVGTEESGGNRGPPDTVKTHRT